MNHLVRSMKLTRQLGQTHALANIARRNDAVLICLNERHAMEVSRNYNVRTESISNARNAYRNAGRSPDKIILDNAVQTMLVEHAINLERENDELTHQMKVLQENSKSAIEDLAKDNNHKDEIISALKKTVGMLSSGICVLDRETIPALRKQVNTLLQALSFYQKHRKDT